MPTKVKPTKAEKIAAHSAASRRGWRGRRIKTATEPTTWLTMLNSETLILITRHAEEIIKLSNGPRRVLGNPLDKKGK